MDKTILGKSRTVFTLDQLPQIAQQLWLRHDACQVYTFTGSLGAGKTTLVREILHAAGVRGAISSPTFTYVNVYKKDAGQRFYHFDLYRLTSADQFYELGFDEYLYAPNSWTFIEWPEILGELVHHKACHVQLEYVSENERAISCTEQD